MDIETGPYLCTLTEKLTSKDLSTVHLVLASENIFFDRSSEVTTPAIALTLENLRKIKANPLCCYQNVVFNSPLEVEHEISQLSRALNIPTPIQEEQPTTTSTSLTSKDKEQQAAPQRQPVRIVILDATREDQGKSPDLLAELEKLNKSVKICRSYLPFSQVQKELSAHEAKQFTEQFVVQKLESYFYLDKISPCIIGPFNLRTVLTLGDKSNEGLIFKGAVAFCRKYKAPLYVDVQGVEDLEGVLTMASSGRSVLPDGKEFAVVLRRIPCRKERKNGGGEQEVWTTESLNFLLAYRALEMGYYVEMAYFGDCNPHLDRVIGSILNKNPAFADRILLALGVEAKVELAKFGGEGFVGMAQLKSSLVEQGVKDVELQKLFVTTPLKVLQWWRPLKIEKKEEVTWNCHECGKEFPESQPKISKLDFEFCSPICFKAGLKKINK